MSLKNAWLIICCAPSSPGAEPSRLLGDLLSNYVSKSLRSVLMVLGNFKFPYRILLNSVSLLFEKYGVAPIIISKRSTPSRYQSSAYPWPAFFNISGARYLIDPQKVLAPLVESFTSFFVIPKSINLA